MQSTAVAARYVRDFDWLCRPEDSTSGFTTGSEARGSSGSKFAATAGFRPAAAPFLPRPRPLPGVCRVASTPADGSVIFYIKKTITRSLQWQESLANTKVYYTLSAPSEASEGVYREYLYYMSHPIDYRAVDVIRPHL